MIKDPVKLALLDMKAVYERRDRRLLYHVEKLIPVNFRKHYRKWKSSEDRSNGVTFYQWVDANVFDLFTLNEYTQLNDAMEAIKLIEDSFEE